MRGNLNYIKQTGMPRFRGFNLLQKFRYDNGGKPGAERGFGGRSYTTPRIGRAE